MATISDGLGHEISTTSRSNGDGSKGFGFQLQDVLRKSTNSGNYSKTTTYFSYIGKHFSGVARYSYNFTYLNGRVTSYLVHTYNNSSIQSISFGISGKTSEVDAKIVNTVDSFQAFGGERSF